MSIDTDVPFIRTQAGTNDGVVVKTKGERSGRCPICGDKGALQRTFEKTVTAFAIHSTTAPTKAEARAEQTKEVTEWVEHPFYHHLCTIDFIDLLEETGILEEILPRIRDHMAARKAQADQITQLSVVGNGA
jgi:hypothetical protein